MGGGGHCVWAIRDAGAAPARLCFPHQTASWTPALAS